MGFIKFPRNLRSNSYIKSLAFKADEPEELAAGRLLLFIDYVSSGDTFKFTHREVDMFAGWKRGDLSYSEVLEHAGFGTIIGNDIKLCFPREFFNELQQRVAGKERAKGLRDERGRLLAKPKKIKPSEVDAEGNQRAPIEQLKKEAKSVSVTSALEPAVKTEKAPLSPPSPPFIPPFSPSPVPSPFIPPIIPPFSPQTPLSATGKNPASEVTAGDKKIKLETEKAVAERRALNEFWRAGYRLAFGQDYPVPPGPRYHAEIKRIHTALGLARAKTQLEFYLSWKDSYVVREGHPLELFMAKLVKMESDRARYTAKQVNAAQAQALQKNITKKVQSQTEVELAYSKIKSERADNPQNLQQSPRSISLPTEAGVRRELSREVGGGSIHDGDGTIHVRSSSPIVHAIPERGGDDPTSGELPSERKIRAAFTSIGRTETSSEKNALADTSRSVLPKPSRSFDEQWEQLSASIDRTKK